jgi:hypothetical protein
MNDSVVGIGIDLTQHVPLVSVAVCPEAIRADGTVDAALLVRHWPPKVELCGSFRPQAPSAVLPLIPGEPLLVGDAAAKHRRSAGLVWPPEAQVPYAGDPDCGVGRIPLVAVWMALLPPLGEQKAMARRDDLEFKWCPDGREHAARAGQMLAASIKAFVNAARLPFNSCFTAIVIPDALDEAGQQILLDSLAQVGMATDNVHLLPRPLAVALHWCNIAGAPSMGQATENEEGTRIGRLRIMTMALDVWEAVSLELRARRHEDRVWIMPVRDRVQLIDAPPELTILGLSFALALARAEANGEPSGWWSRMFTSDWLEKKLAANRDLSSQELKAFREVYSLSLPESLRQELSQLAALRPLWSRFQTGPRLQEAVRQRWQNQERNIGTAELPCAAVLADGAFAGLRMEHDSTLAHTELPQTPGVAIQVFLPSQPAAARGAALVAAAIAHGLPCYRETLLPLDLCVRGTDEYDDPVLRWKSLVSAHSVEAGRPWHSPTPVTGLQIEQSQDCLSLPLRRALLGTLTFRRVSTELATAATRDEPVHVGVEVKPGQGFARVRIESATPGVFAARLDWSTMEECDEPKPQPLAYLPGVSRILPDREMFERARPTLEKALHALERNNSDARERLRSTITLLNKFPLAHNVERGRGRTFAKDFILHYGIIGSDSNLSKSPEQDLIRALRDAIGKKFGELVQRRNASVALVNTLLRAGGWFYLSMPKECFDYLRSRLVTANRNFQPLSAVELHAIGLTFEAPNDLRLFYPLVIRALDAFPERPNNWLRAVRNICRFRNHALHPNIISDTDLYHLIERLFETLQQQVARSNFARIFGNCLEAMPFLLKRRRYDPEFLTPTSQLAQDMIRFLEKVDYNNRRQLSAKELSSNKSIIF